MRSYKDVAFKEIWHQKFSSILIVIALILSSAMTTVIGQSIGTMDAMRIEQAKSLNGDRYVTFHQVDITTTRDLGQNSALTQVVPFITLSTAELPDSGLSLYIREFMNNDTSVYQAQYRLKEGRQPEKAYEIALPESVLQRLDKEVKIGDSIQIPMEIALLQDTELPYQYDATFTLTGILENEYIGYVNGVVNALVGSGTAELLLPERYQIYSVDCKTTSKKDFQTTIYKLEETYHLSDDLVQYNDLLLNAAHISYDSKKDNFSDDSNFYMTFAGAVVGILVLTAAGLVIYNVLKIQLEKSIKNYGILRALGATKGKLYNLVLIKILILNGIGLPIGAIIGICFSEFITKIAINLFEPEVFMVETSEQMSNLVARSSTIDTSFLALTLGLTMIFSILSAIPAARIASQISPIQSISGRKVKVVKHRTRKIRNFEAFYARLNMRRNLSRSIITSLSLVLCIAIFIALQSFSYLLDVSTELQTMHVGDYSLTNSETGFSPEIVEKLSGTEDVEKVSTLNFSLYQPDNKNNLSGIQTNILLNPAETLQICGMDEDWMLHKFADLSQDQQESIALGQGCIVANPVKINGVSSQGPRERDYVVGDEIDINGEHLEVVYVANEIMGLENKGFTNGVQIITTNIGYALLTGSDRIAECYLSVRENADREYIENVIQKICDNNPGSKWLSYEETDQQLKESYAQIRILAWGIILFVGMIGLLNIINTTYTNVYSRRHEIGVQRALGMSIRNLYKTFLWEGVYYSTIAIFLGVSLGCLCTLVIGASLDEEFQFVVPPFTSIIQVAFSSVICCMLAIILPLVRVKKMSIVECIKNEE